RVEDVPREGRAVPVREGSRRTGDSGPGEGEIARDRQGVPDRLDRGPSEGPDRLHHAGPRRRGPRPSGLQEAAPERRRLGREEMKTVYVLATLDTKGVEAAFVRD